jgi:hypothetical protein
MKDGKQGQIEGRIVIPVDGFRSPDAVLFLEKYVDAGILCKTVVVAPVSKPIPVVETSKPALVVETLKVEVPVVETIKEVVAETPKEIFRGRRQKQEDIESLNHT